MKVFANREIRILFRTVLAVWAVALALTQGIVWHTTHVFSFGLLLVFLLLGGCLWGVLFRYFQRQSALLEQAVQQIQSCLDGNPDARLDCDREGEFYRLFHSVNALAAVLSAHADNEQREKRFLKNTIADISHQLKTPLAHGVGANGNSTLGTGAIGGMFIGMICQIFIVPALFVVFEHIQEKVKPLEWHDTDNTDIASEIEQYTK